MRIDLKETAKFLTECGDAYILTHQSPDGDTFGCAFALYYVLTGMGKKAKVLCSDDFPERYGFMFENYTDTEFEPKCVIAVDVADVHLLGKLKNEYRSSVDLCIDHHISNTMYAQKVLLDAEAAAASEIMYEVFGFMGDVMTADVATCIYTGIATDSGCFKYSNTSARTHRIASELMLRFKIDYARINREMFDVKTKGRLKMEKLLVDIMEFYLDDKCSIVCISQDILNELDVEYEDLDGVAALPLQVRGVEVGVTIKEKSENEFKVSMRSSDKADVSAICGRLGGGGHIKAAGCLLKGTLDEVKERIVSEVAPELEKLK